MNAQPSRRHEQPAPEGAKRCTKCAKVKPLGAFHRCPSRDRMASWCKTCVRVQVIERQHTPEYRVWLKDYLARPEVQARRREAEARRQHTPARRARKNERQRAYDQTPRGKVLHCRRQAYGRLRKATDPERVLALSALIASYDAELTRLEKGLSEGRRT